MISEHGQVLSWQLTKRTTFYHIKTLLSDLLEQPQQQIHTVYIDECCKLRAKIKSVLGPNVAVKLDLFHAVQRITKTLSKKHGLIQQCMIDLRRVTAKRGDCPPLHLLTSFFQISMDLLLSGKIWHM